MCSKRDEVAVGGGFWGRSEELVTFETEEGEGSFGWIADLETADAEVGDPRTGRVLFFIHHQEAVIKDDIAADGSGGAFPNDSHRPSSVVGLAKRVVVAIARESVEVGDGVSAVEVIACTELFDEGGDIGATIEKVEVAEDTANGLAGRRRDCDTSSVGKSEVHRSIGSSVDGACPPKIGGFDFAIKGDAADLRRVLRKKDIVDVSGWAC